MSQEYNNKPKSKNTFIKNASILASGSIIGQLIVIVASPVLTRIYSIEDFGILAVFTSTCTILALFTTGRYELAIVLPKSTNKALKLIKLISCIALAVSLFYLFTIFTLKEVLKINDPTSFLKHNSVYLAPLYIFAVALLSALTYWYQRKKAYKTITTANALTSIINTVISLTLGFLMVSNGMIWGLVGSVILVVIFYIAKEKNLPKNVFKEKNIIDVGKEYSSFPKYMIISDLSLNANQQLTPILFSSLFGSIVVGHYSLANKMLRLPNIIITNSIANVFRNDAIDEIREYGNCKNLYISTLKKLFVISFPVYLLIFIISPFIFKIVFGSNWGLAGEFGQIMSFYLFVEFMATPLNTLFYVRDKQKKIMILQSINLLFSITMLWLGALLFNNPKASIILYSVNAILFNFYLIHQSYQLAKST